MMRLRCVKKRFILSACDLDGEGVFRLRGRANFARGLIHLPVECVFVDSARASVKPDRGRSIASSDCLAQHASRIYSRLQNLPPVALIVPAIHRSAAEID